MIDTSKYFLPTAITLAMHDSLSGSDYEYIVRWATGGVLVKGSNDTDIKIDGIRVSLKTNVVPLTKKNPTLESYIGATIIVKRANLSKLKLTTAILKATANQIGDCACARYNINHLNKQKNDSELILLRGRKNGKERHFGLFETTIKPIDNSTLWWKDQTDSKNRVIVGYPMSVQLEEATIKNYRYRFTCQDPRLFEAVTITELSTWSYTDEQIEYVRKQLQEI